MRIKSSIADKLELDKIRLKWSYPQYEIEDMYNTHEMALKDEKILEIKSNIKNELEVLTAQRELLNDSVDYLLHSLEEIEINHCLLLEALGNKMKEQMLKKE